MAYNPSLYTTVNAYKTYIGLIVRLMRDRNGNWFSQLENPDGELLKGFEARHLANSVCDRVEALNESHRLYGAPVFTIL